MSAVRIAVPPGRAGRLLLDRRLVGARRAADLLDRKLRILQAELRELSAEATRTEQEWHLRCAEADRRLLIAALLGGERAIILATGSGYADARIDYAVTIGVRRPASGHYAPAPGAEPWAGPHVAQARQAHRAALAAAVRYAAAAGAYRTVEAEVVTTRYRLHAIGDRLIPRLEQARAEVMLAIDELERADDARLRRRNPAAWAP
jgi:V/A-type H+/Na+-transporting ATPase subunit D